jgi:predicted esterase
MNILCLHGFNSNSERLELKNHIHTKNSPNTYHYLNGPHQLPSDGQNYCWYYYDNENPLNINWENIQLSQESQLIGLSESTQKIIDFIANNKIDAIIGFSQGGSMLFHLLEQKLISIKKAIFVGTFIPYNLHSSYQYLETPSLHIIGKNDEVILPSWSQQLADRFKTRVILEHNGKHVFPNNGHAKSVYRDFFSFQKN